MQAFFRFFSARQGEQRGSGKVAEQARPKSLGCECEPTGLSVIRFPKTDGWVATSCYSARCWEFEMQGIGKTIMAGAAPF
jgi:hypothetical protein